VDRVNFYHYLGCFLHVRDQEKYEENAEHKQAPVYITQRDFCDFSLGL